MQRYFEYLPHCRIDETHSICNLQFELHVYIRAQGNFKISKMTIYVYVYISICGLSFYVCLLRKDLRYLEGISETKTAIISFQYQDGLSMYVSPL